jgi:hypothetical protein
MEEEGEEKEEEEESAAARAERAAHRLAGLRARLLHPQAETGAAGAAARLRPPLVQSVLDAIPATLEPEQMLRALEWLDANREGVAALPCLPMEGEEAAAAPKALFHFSSAEDTPLLRQWGGRGAV